jgi:MGT family glycosyltransferase
LTTYLNKGEEVRSEKEFEEPLKSFLEPFKPINPLKLNDELKIDDSDLRKNSDLKLVYASFGTVVNQDVDQYRNVIESINHLSNDEFNNIRLLISTGTVSYKMIQELVKEKKLQIPKNVLLMERVPQLDVLKRASLFITHCGQNSTSEAIHYGVPMLAVPVMGDQLVVAYRMSDELGLGKRILYEKANPILIKENMMEILNDKNYLERSALYSKISRKYNGSADGAKLVIEFLDSKTKKIK